MPERATASPVAAALLLAPSVLAGCMGAFECSETGPPLSEHEGRLTSEDRVLEFDVDVPNSTGLVVNLTWTYDARDAGVGVAAQLVNHSNPGGDARWSVESEACQEWESVPSGSRTLRAFWYWDSNDASDDDRGPPREPPEPMDVTVTVTPVS